MLRFIFLFLVIDCSLFCLVMQSRIYEDDVIMQQYLQLFFYCWSLIDCYFFIAGYYLLVIVFSDAIPHTW